MLYSWQQSIWNSITSMENIPHALIFYGQEGIGKDDFAKYFASWILCNNKEKTLCNSCKSCLLIKADNHPDLYNIFPEEKKSTNLGFIKIESIRNIIEKVNLSSNQGNRRIVLIHKAEKLNIQAANALLKILEEPMDDLIFILITSNLDRIIPTIKSRCVKIHLPNPNIDEAKNFLLEKQFLDNDISDFLAFNQGSLLIKEDEKLKTLRLKLLDFLSKPKIMDLLNISEELSKEKELFNLSIFTNWVSKWIVDCIVVFYNNKNMFYPKYYQSIVNIINNISILEIFKLYNKIISLNKIIEYNLNLRLQIENILLDYLFLFFNVRKATNGFYRG